MNHLPNISMSPISDQNHRGHREQRFSAEALNWVIAIFLKYMSPVAYVLTGNAPGNEAMGLMIKIKRADWWCRCLKVQHGSTPYIMANTDSFVA